MSIFEYSRAAQSILPKFYGVDILLFVEGTNGEDCLFWENIFEQFCSKKVKISQRGGKGELLKILNQDGGLADNIYIALDRDLEDVCPKIGKRKNLIYTYGYSYENDLYSEELIADIIRRHLHIPKKPEIQKKIRICMQTFATEIAPYMCAFAKAYQKHISILPTQSDNTNFEAFFSPKKHTLEHKYINKCIARLNDKCCASGKHKSFNNIRYCNGHLFETFVCRLINCFCKNKKLIYKDDLRELALRGFEKFLSSNVRDYYRSTLSEI